MMDRAIGYFLCSAIFLAGSTGLVLADMVGRYECSVVGPSIPEPVGDRADHTVQTVQYSCVGVDGLLKGAVMTGSTVVEWQGPKSKFLSASTTHRTPGGLAVGQLLEGNGSVVMKDGRPLGQEATGKATIKFASGALAGLSGKNLKWVSKPVGLNRFEQEYGSE
ncbi:MAG: hypothetical protein GY844_26855 [Bradyrhizobium sp.]|nr:hypothetical protein [Bradyrhizobium sp.]